MGYDTLIGHFDFGGKTYPFVTASELKFEPHMGRWKTNIEIQTGSDEVREMLMQIFHQQLKIRLQFDISKGKIKFIDIHDCFIYAIAPYTFGAGSTLSFTRAKIEGYLESTDYIEEKVMLT